MDLRHISSAVVWVDFFTIVLHKFFNLGRSLDVWYSKFGIVAVISDCLVIVLGILLAQFFTPGNVLLGSIAIQLLHDYLFYLLVSVGYVFWLIIILQKRFIFEDSIIIKCRKNLV